MSFGTMNDPVVMKNYKALAQLYAIANGQFSNKHIAIQQAINQSNHINYQVPNDKFFAISQPQLIGCTALHIALEKKDLDIFRLLLEYGANFNIEDHEGATVLHRSLHKDCFSGKEFWEVKGKFENPFTDLVLSAHVKANDCSNSCSKNGISNFHIACMANNVNAAQLFIQHAVPINQVVDTAANIFAGYTALHFAARYCSIETVEMLLKNDADPRIKDAAGLIPLHIVVKRTLEILDFSNVQKEELSEKLVNELNDNRKIMKVMFEKLSAGDPNFVDNIGLTGLHVACILDDIPMIQQLIRSEADLDYSIYENSMIWADYTPLHFAAKVSMSTIKILLDYNAKMNVKAKNGVTPFDLCIERYAVSDINFIVTNEKFLQSIKFSVDTVSLTKFIFSLQSENLFDSLLLRVDKTMTILFDSPLWSGYSLLHLVILFCNRIESIDNLQSLKYIYNIWKARQDLLRALKDNYREEMHKLYYKRINKILSLWGSLINKTDAKGSTPLHLAFRLQNRSVLRLLLKYSEQVENMIDGNGVSHFHIACVMRETKLAKKLLDLAADVNLSIDCTFEYLTSDDDYFKPQICLSTPGSTPLHLAVVTNNVESTEILLEHGADVFARDGDGLTPLHRVFALTDRYEVGEILLSASNLQDCVTHFGLNFLHVACYVGHAKAVKRLLDFGVHIEATYYLPENRNNLNMDEKFAFLKRFAGLTPLYIAMTKRHFEVTRLLIKRGADIFAKSTDGHLFLSDILSSDMGFSHSFLYSVLDVNNTELVDQLTKQIGLTQLHSHCFDPDEHDVMCILKFNGADPNASVYSDSPMWPGKTALHFVAMSIIHSIKNESDSLNLKRTVEWLLQYGADGKQRNSDL